MLAILQKKSFDEIFPFLTIGIVMYLLHKKLTQTPLKFDEREIPYAYHLLLKI